MSRKDSALHFLAMAGVNVCGYHFDPETWKIGTCDCKYLPGPSLLPLEDEVLGSEQTGCCEIRSLYRKLQDRL